MERDYHEPDRRYTLYQDRQVTMRLGFKLMVPAVVAETCTLAAAYAARRLLGGEGTITWKDSGDGEKVYEVNP